MSKEDEKPKVVIRRPKLTGTSKPTKPTKEKENATNNAEVQSKLQPRI